MNASAAVRGKTESRWPIMLWSALGLLFLVTQLYVYGAWILSDDFRATEVGPDPIPAYSLIGLRVYEVLSIVTLLFVIPWFVHGIRQTGTINTTRLLMIGFLATYWTDPWLNFLRPMFTYNAYMFNRGCWCEFIPFWQAANGSRIAEPLLIDPAAYFYAFPSTVWTAWWLMVKARNRWPGISDAMLCLIGFVGVWLTMSLLDVFATRVLYFDAWPGATQSQSWWGGSFYQFPIYEFVAFPSIFVAAAFLVFYTDDRGQTAIERGIGSLRLSSRKQIELVRILAFIGFCNFLNILYTTGLGVHALYVDPWPTEVPSWLANEQCGSFTNIPCEATATPP